MSIISSLPAGLTRSQPLGATGGSDQQLGQAAFLKLMTAQLKFQDPFDPVDNQAMVAQMAQFSSVAGISEMNVSLKEIASSFGTSRLSEAANLIGRSVLLSGDIAPADYAGGYSGEFSLAAPAQDVSIEWLNAAGDVVHTQQLGALNAGPVPFRLEMTNDQGTPNGPPVLRYRVVGAAASGLSAWVPVTGVEANASGSNAMLVTPVGNVAVAEARRIA